MKKSQRRFSADLIIKFQKQQPRILFGNYYDAALARFVTADTVVDGEFSVSGWNRYSYVSNNPVLYKDPTGHNAWSGSTDLDLTKPWNNSNVDSTGEYYSYCGKRDLEHEIRSQSNKPIFRNYIDVVAAAANFTTEFATHHDYNPKLLKMDEILKNFHDDPTWVPGNGNKNYKNTSASIACLYGKTWSSIRYTRGDYEHLIVKLDTRVYGAYVALGG